MASKPAPPLIAAPYAAPRCKIGAPLADRIRGDVPVDGITDAPVPWPFTRYRGAGVTRSPHPILILTGDLERAVRTESSLAVAHHWGVAKSTVYHWRKALGVDDTEGSRRARSANAREVIGAVHRRKADERMRAAVAPRKLAAIRSAIGDGRTNWWIADTVGVPVAVVRRVRERAAETTTTK